MVRRAGVEMRWRGPVRGRFRGLPCQHLLSRSAASSSSSSNRKQGGRSSTAASFVSGSLNDLNKTLKKELHRFRGSCSQENNHRTTGLICTHKPFGAWNLLIRQCSARVHQEVSKCLMCLDLDGIPRFQVLPCLVPCLPGGWFLHADFVSLPAGQSQDRVRQCIQSQGGSVSLNLSKAVTHCIAANSGGG